MGSKGPQAGHTTRQASGQVRPGGGRPSPAPAQLLHGAADSDTHGHTQHPLSPPPSPHSETLLQEALEGAHKPASSGSSCAQCC